MGLGLQLKVLCLEDQWLNMENLNMPLTLLNDVLGYLGTRPYQEVVGLINALQTEFQKQSALNIVKPEE